MPTLIQILTAIPATQPLIESKGVFLSGYDTTGLCVVSQGIYIPTSDLTTMISSLYTQYIQPQPSITRVAIDIVVSHEPVADTAHLMTLDMTIYGLYIYTGDSAHTAVMLPHTIGVQTAQQAIQTIQKKHSLTGDVHIESFITNRYIFPGS